MVSQLRDAFLRIKGLVGKHPRKTISVLAALVFALFGILLSRVNSDTRLSHADEVVNFAWSRDGQLIATSSDGDLFFTIWSRDGKRLKEIPRPSGAGSAGFLAGPIAFFPGNDDFIVVSAWTFATPGDVAVSILDWKRGIRVRDLKAQPLPAEINIPQFVAANNF
jgi:WD40 repeat protein